MVRGDLACLLWLILFSVGDVNLGLFSLNLAFWRPLPSFFPWLTIASSRPSASDAVTMPSKGGEASSKLRPFWWLLLFFRRRKSWIISSIFVAVNHYTWHTLTLNDGFSFSRFLSQKPCHFVIETCKFFCQNTVVKLTGSKVSRQLNWNENVGSGGLRRSQCSAWWGSAADTRGATVQNARTLSPQVLFVETVIL